MEKLVLKPENELSSQGEETKVLYTDVCQIINNARTRLATYANAEVCMTNYYVGKRIKEDVLYNKRADYGKEILQNLAKELTEKFGKGWGVEKLRQCVHVAECFTEEERGCIKSHLTLGTLFQFKKDSRSPDFFRAGALLCAKFFVTLHHDENECKDTI